MLTLTQARRIALAASGFADRAPTGVPERRHLKRVLGRTGLLQIDSVNVVQRAHYLPAYSRLGPYPTELLDRLAYRRPRELFEYWAHEASLVPVHLHPALRWRMQSGSAWGRMVRMAREQPDLIRWVLDEIRDKGPITANEVEGDLARPRSKEHWGWNWSDTKTAIEWLFYTGEVSVASRNSSFARVYDVPERILPAAVLAAPTLSPPMRTATWSGSRRGPSASPPRPSCATTSACRSPAPAPRSPSSSRPASSSPPRSRAGSPAPTCTTRRPTRAASAPPRS